jgi:hypothetical protein
MLGSTFNEEKAMSPFRSEKQRRFMWKFHPKIARRWAEKAKRKRSKKGKK